MGGAAAGLGGPGWYKKGLGKPQGASNFNPKKHAHCSFSTDNSPVSILEIVINSSQGWKDGLVLFQRTLVQFPAPTG